MAVKTAENASSDPFIFFSKKLISGRNDCSGLFAAVRFKISSLLFDVLIRFSSVFYLLDLRFTEYHSLKDLSGLSGISRCLYLRFTPLLGENGACFNPPRRVFPAIL